MNDDQKIANDLQLDPASIDQAETKPASVFEQWPYHVQLDGSNKGLYLTEIDKNGAQKVMRLSAPLLVEGLARTEESKDWAYCVTFTDPDNHPHRVLLWMADEHNCATWLSKMATRGLTAACIPKVDSFFKQYITGYTESDRFTIARTVGWNKANDQFLLPSGAARGKSNEEVLFVPHGEDEPIEAIPPSCVLNEWKSEVADLCRGNSILVLAICTAFAAPLLKLTDQSNVTFNIFGQSSTGKSTALNIASSVCGPPDKYRRSWKATNAGFEQHLARCNDCLVCLDEIGEASEALLDSAPYAISAGRGKLKSSRNQTLQESTSWRNLVLSSGELAFEQALDRKERRVQAGQAVRCIDIPADAGAGMGVFEQLNEYTSPRDLADALNANAQKYNSIALAEFIDRLIENLPDVMACVPGELAEIAGKICPPKPSGQVARVARSFALLAFAGKLACIFDVLPFQEQEVDDAILKCFEAWLEHRGTTGELEPEEGVRQVRMFCQAHGKSRFENWYLNDRVGTVRDRVGFFCPDNEHAGFYVFPDAFKKVICKGLDHSRVIDELVRRSLLLTDRKGLSKVVYVPGNRSQRLYHLSLDILDETDA